VAASGYRWRWAAPIASCTTWARGRSWGADVDILSRSTGLSQIRHQRAALDDGRIDLLIRPPVAELGTLDFKGGIALIEVGYRHAAEALSKSAGRRPGSWQEPRRMPRVSAREPPSSSSARAMSSRH
jgi:hypothetical protein